MTRHKRGEVEQREVCLLPADQAPLHVVHFLAAWGEYADTLLVADVSDPFNEPEGQACVLLLDPLPKDKHGRPLTDVAFTCLDDALVRDPFGLVRFGG